MLDFSKYNTDNKKDVFLCVEDNPDDDYVIYNSVNPVKIIYYDTINDKLYNKKYIFYNLITVGEKHDSYYNI